MVVRGIIPVCLLNVDDYAEEEDAEDEEVEREALSQVFMGEIGKNGLNSRRQWQESGHAQRRENVSDQDIYIYIYDSLEHYSNSGLQAQLVGVRQRERLP